MSTKNNPFSPKDAWTLITKYEQELVATRFLATMYNLGLGFQDLDDVTAVHIVMELEDLLDGIKTGSRCLE